MSAEGHRRSLERMAERNPGRAARTAIDWHEAAGRDPSRAELLEGGAVILAQALVARGRCAVCGRALSDPHSVAAGIGPDCARDRAAAASWAAGALGRAS